MKRNRVSETNPLPVRGSHTARGKPSRRWTPMRRIPAGDDVQKLSRTGEPIELWENDRYYATVRRWKRRSAHRPTIIIGVSRIDETAVHDWRDLQYAKNDIAGPEWLGIEVYPPESQKLDPSNRYYLQCFPAGLFSQPMRPADLIFGGGRSVLSPADAIAPQRGFSGLPV